MRPAVDRRRGRIRGVRPTRPLAELRRGGARSAAPSMVGRPLERGRDVRVRPVDCEREVAGPLLVVVDELRRGGVERAVARWRRDHVRRGCEQRMGEPDVVAVELEHVRRERRVERGVAVPAAASSGSVGCASAAAAPSAVRVSAGQCVDPVADELLQFVGNRQRLARCRRRSQALERATQLEREERVAGGHVVDPAQRGPGEAELDPGSKETVDRAKAQRLDVEAGRSRSSTRAAGAGSPAGGAARRPTGSSRILRHANDRTSAEAESSH